MKPDLRVIRPEAEPAPTYATVPEPVRRQFAELDARISRVRTALSGSFTTTVKLAEAERELHDIESLARSARISIRRGW